MLAIIMILEIMMPATGVAKEITPRQNNLVRVGTIDTKSYPQPDVKLIQEVNRRKRQELNGRKMEKGAQLFSAPYFPEPGPDDNQKPLIFANVNAIFTTKGLDGGKFDWEGVFGKDADGKPNKAQIVFEQMDNETLTRTGVKFFLKVDKEGTYTWSDSEGKPTKLPLYSTDLKPYKYEVLLDEDVSDHVKLLTSRFMGTEGGYSFGQPDSDTGEIVGNINLDLALQQIASTKFISKWNTGVVEADRPTVEGLFLTGYEADPEDYGIFKFPSNDTDKTIIRNDALDPQNPGDYSEYIASQLEKTPTVGVADPDPDATDTYTLDRDNNKISYKGKTYKYEVTYDVINGGKLTMTEILPITFDANEGEFENYTSPDTDKKIVKEVEYGKDLTDEVEKPKKALETFKGWAPKADGPALSEEKFKEAITNVTEAKTFYAIWGNNDITAEELVVHESFKDGDNWINEFTPTMDELAKQVRIKGEDGKYTSLNIKDHGFAVLDDSGQEIASTELANRLYDKLKEDENTEVSRKETIKVRVYFKKTDKTVDVDVPIKVIKNIYEAKTKEGKPVYVPDNYVKVTLDPTTKATDPQKTYYYVNPDAKVVIPGENPTGTNGNTFINWLIDGTETEYKLSEKPRHQFDSVTTIKAQYSKDVIPANDDGSKPDRTPDNFVEVKFVPTDKATYETKAEKIYWVNPNKEVTVPAADVKAKVGYKFKKWDKELTQKFTTKTTITAEYTEYNDIIPSTKDDGTPNDKPEGYVTLTFDKGDHGKEITGQSVYYVNPKADPTKTLGDTSIVKPEVKAEVGYKFTGWDTKDDFEIKADKTVTAKYDPIDDVIPKTKDDNSEKPDGYITVTFVKGDHGKELTGQAVYYVNPNKAVVLKDKAPTPVPNTGYEFARWDISIDQAIQYKDGAKITALYNDPDNISTTEVEGYVKVEFKPGTNGSLEGTQIYWIKPGVEVNIPAPTVKPDLGYKFNNWDKDLTVNLKANSPTYEITAEYKPLDDIIPQKNTDGSDKPEGYKVVKFVADDNGSLSGTTVYYVNPEKEVDLTDTANKITKKPNVGFVADGGKWTNEDNTDAALKATFENDKTFVYHFQSYKDVIPAEKIDQKPEGYVKVEFIAGENGKLEEGNKTYYVNPLKNITVGSDDLKIPTPVPNKNYDFDAWYEKIDDKPIKTDKKFVARFKLAKVTMTYEADDKTSGEVPAALSYDVGTEITLAGGNDLKKDNYSLTGWMIGEKIYKPGEKIILNENTTAVAVWDENLHTVQFDTDGGNYIPAQKVKHDTAIGEVPSPTKKGYLFVGWTLDGKIINPEEYKVTKDITLVAEYSEDVIPADKDGNPPAGTPDNFVKVSFVPTAEGKLEGTSIFYVNPEKEVIIPVNNPVGKGKKIFSAWKLGADAKGDEYNPKKAKLFDKETIITATYEEKSLSSGEIIEVNGIESNPMKVDKDDEISDDQLISQLILPKGKSIKGAKVIKRPNTKVGDEFTSAIITVSYDDGTQVDTKVLIYVREPCKPCPAPEPGDNPGGGGYIPTPDPDPTLPDGGDDEKEPEDKEKTPDEENGKEKNPDREETPDKDKEETPEKPGDKDPKKPGQNQPPVKNDSKKNLDQTGTKIVKTINQTGTKVINQVKNFLNPTTGIISNYGLYIGLMAASSVGLFFTRDKKNEDEE